MDEKFLLETLNLETDSFVRIEDLGKYSERE